MKYKNIKNKIKGKGQINTEMSLYEINQSIIGQLPAYTNEQLSELKDKILTWSIDNFENSEYFMLLCKDINYYTVFCYNIEKTVEGWFFGEAVVQILIESGYTIHSDEILDDHCEIWAKNETGTYAFMLFPYDQGVVYYG